MPKKPDNKITEVHCECKCGNKAIIKLHGKTYFNPTVCCASCQNSMFITAIKRG